MQRLPDPMVTPTVQYEGTIQGNQDAMTAPGSANFIPPAQNFTTPVDLVPTADGKGHVDVSSQRDRTQGNPVTPGQFDGGGWAYTRSGTAGGWKEV